MKHHAPPPLTLHENMLPSADTQVPLILNDTPTHLANAYVHSHQIAWYRSSMWFGMVRFKKLCLHYLHTEGGPLK